MASARLKSGKWYYRITLTVGDGSHKYIERGGFKTKKEALDAGKRVEIRYKDGEDVSRPKFMSFNFLSSEWEEAINNTLKASTIFEYKKVLKTNILPTLSNYNVSAINTQTLQALIDSYTQNGGSWSRLYEIRNVLSSIFKYAYKAGYVKTNPMNDLILPTKRSRTGEKLKSVNHTHVCPKEEIDAIFKRFPEGTTAYIPLVLGYRCGLRKGEAFGVCIDDLDFKNNLLHVRHQISQDKKTMKYYFTSPKWKVIGDERIIALDKETARILEKHVQKLLDLSLTLHYPVYYVDQNGLLNTDSGKVIFPISLHLDTGIFAPPTILEYVTHVVHGVVSKIDYVDKDWDFHSLRHTHASMCIAAGMNPVSVQKRLGHKSLDTTYRYYVHETSTEVTESKGILEKMYS